jgi:hypothetical protein
LLDPHAVDYATVSAAGNGPVTELGTPCAGFSVFRPHRFPIGLKSQREKLCD